MEKYTGGKRIYRLYCVDPYGIKVQLLEKNSIEKLDEFTKQFEDRDDLLMQLSERYEINFQDFFVESKKEKQKPNTPGKKIRDIVYKGNPFPEIGKLQDLYIDYLLENRERIRQSFAYYKPKFMSDEGVNVEPYILESSVRAKIKDYMKIRQVYFELLKNGKVSGTIEIDYVKELKEQKLKEIIDNFISILNDINTEYPDIDPDELTEEDVENISENIMVEKVRSGEYEPFEVFDLEDYIRMQNKGIRR